MPEPKSLKGKKILIFQQRNWAVYTGHIIAKKLAAEGCRLAALTLKRSTHKYISEQKEVHYEVIINNDDIMADPEKFLGTDDYTLAEICQNLNVDSVWPLVSTLRNHVRSYKDKYYYSFKQNVSDENIILYVKALYKCIRIFFDKFDPDYIISPNYVSLPHIMFNLYAEHKGRKMIAVTDCKVKGIYIITNGFKDDHGPFYDRVDALNNKQAKSNNIQKAKNYIKEFRQSFKHTDKSTQKAEKKKLIKRVKDILRPYYQIFCWYTKPRLNFVKSIGVTGDFRPPKIILRDYFCHKRNTRFMNNYEYYPIEKLKKFVFFPLQFQPEANIDVVAPYFSNQIEVARQVAMSLPDDYVLAVKEHPAMLGLRPPSYLEKVARTVNVKLIDYRIPSEKILQKTDLIIAPNSTTFTEAAFYNKPAIQLGNLGTTLKLPNVTKHTDMTILSSKIKEVLNSDYHSDQYEWQLENYVAAAFDAGFDFDFEGAWGSASKESTDNLWRMLKEQLN